MSDVLSAKRITTGDWVAVASLCGTSSLSGTSGGPTAIDNIWASVALERDAAAVSGEDRTRPSEAARGTTRTFVLELLLVADSPEAGLALLDGIKLLFPIGQLATLKMGDAERVIRGTVDAIRDVRVPRVKTDDWTHGDRLVSIPFTLNDPAFYDEEAIEETILAATAQKIDVGALKSFWLFEADGPFDGIVLEVFRDVANSPASTPYGTLTIDVDVAGGETLVVDTRDGVDDAYIEDSPDHLWGSITAGWFFRLGEQIGEAETWFKSSRAGTLTYERRW